MNQLYEDIKCWLWDYLRPEDRERVIMFIFRVTWKHVKRGMLIGLIIGFILGMITIGYFA